VKVRRVDGNPHYQPLLREEQRALYRCSPRSAPEHLRSRLS
jgi:hypothetical protein